MKHWKRVQTSAVFCWVGARRIVMSYHRERFDTADFELRQVNFFKIIRYILSSIQGGPPQCPKVNISVDVFRYVL